MLEPIALLDAVAKSEDGGSRYPCLAPCFLAKKPGEDGNVQEAARGGIRRQS